MNQRNSNDKLDPQDPERHNMQPPIPTSPADPAAAGEADKVVAPPKPAADPNDGPVRPYRQIRPN